VGSVAGIAFGVAAGALVWAVFENAVYWGGDLYDMRPLAN
jgi:hypothetical protein